MFYIRTLKKEFVLEPKDLGPRLKETISRRLTEQTEGTLQGELGYVIAVIMLKDEDIKPGRIEYETGYVEVSVTYQALLFRPYKYEILDATVMSVVEHGIFADAGPITDIFINKHQMPEDYQFDQIEGVWRTEDMQVEIRPGVGIRMRVIGVDFSQRGVVVVGSIRDDYTGFILAENA